MANWPILQEESRPGAADLACSLERTYAPKTTRAIRIQGKRENGVCCMLKAVYAMRHVGSKALGLLQMRHLVTPHKNFTQSHLGQLPPALSRKSLLTSATACSKA